ncbi:hypothetical protein AB0J01_28230 [Streptomyces sp. NPDC050204]|uniref:hypothetical protein n=1 Tax=Streptomyces sp. NPDC050204 TaxID=3155514 RepID=UPI00342B084D
MLELRLVDQDNYTVTLPGFVTVMTVKDQDADKTAARLLGVPAKQHAAYWQSIARQHAKDLGGEATANGRSALARAKRHDARHYRVTRTPVQG